MFWVNSREWSRRSDDKNKKPTHGPVKVHAYAGMLHRYRPITVFNGCLPRVPAFYLDYFEHCLGQLLVNVHSYEVKIRTQYLRWRYRGRSASLHWHICPNRHCGRPMHMALISLHLQLVISSLLRHSVWKQRWLQESGFCDDIQWGPHRWEESL